MGHTWIHNPKTGGDWRCPDAVLDEYLEAGWVLTNPPPEPDPATAERIAIKQANQKPRRGAKTEESES